MNEPAVIITKDNWREAAKKAAAAFSKGWFAFSDVFHFFDEAQQRSICGRVTRNGLPPMHGRMFNRAIRYSCPECNTVRRYRLNNLE